MNARAVSDEPNVAAENINAHLDLEGQAHRPDAARRRRERRDAQGLWRRHARRRDAQPTSTSSSSRTTSPTMRHSICAASPTPTSGSPGTATRSSSAAQVTIDEAGLTGDINFDTGLLASMTARRKLDLTEERNPILERVRFNVDVNTATPILVDNNLARAEIERDLTVVGTPYETGLLGELTLLEGSRDSTARAALRDRARRPHVRGRTPHLPSFDLLLNTTAGTYDITIAVTGTPGDTETTLDLQSHAARARHHGHARHRPHARRHARRGVRGRARAGPLVSGRTSRVEARARTSAGDRPERGPDRADADRQRDRPERAAHARPGADRRPEARLLDQSHRQQRSDLGRRVRRHAPVPDARRPPGRQQLSTSTSATTCDSAGVPSRAALSACSRRSLELAVVVPAGNRRGRSAQGVRREGGRRLRLLRDSQRHPARRGIAHRAGLPAVARPSRA